MRGIVIVWILLVGQLAAQERTDTPVFQRIFQQKGIEFTAEQQEKVDALRNELITEIRKLQQKQNRIPTDEQRRARREAFRAARRAGKIQRKAREAAQAAVELTEEQKAEWAALRQERTRLLKEAEAAVRGLLTSEQRKKLQQSRARGNRPSLKPTHADLKYGPAERNVMDVWLADSDAPTPVLVSIHGGGFRGGNKHINRGLLRQCLDAGISAAAITYRLTDEVIAPAQMMDAARAVQFIRHHAEEWNIDPKRMAATGGSAGAGISLWLGFHDNLADPDNEDPVLRESTRLTCMYVHGAQTSYDPRFIRDMFPTANVYRHPALAQLYGVNLNELDELPKGKYELFEQISPINYVTKDDPPAILQYGMPLDAKPDIHHPLFGKLLKEKMDELGIRCHVYADDQILGGERRLSVIEFIKQEFGIN